MRQNYLKINNVRKKMNRTLIITGCIEPVKQNFLKILDVNERLEQYIESVEYYIKESLCDHIIFVKIVILNMSHHS